MVIRSILFSSNTTGIHVVTWDSKYRTFSILKKGYVELATQNRDLAVPYEKDKLFKEIGL